MGQPPDDNFDDWMNASAEDWSKPTDSSATPEPTAQPTDRWGSPISSKEQQNDPRRWGSDQPAPTPGSSKARQKSKIAWWLILIIVLVPLCLCTCVVVLGLELFDVISIF